MDRRAPSRSDGRLLAGEGNKYFVFAVPAANPGESLLQISAFEKGCYRFLNNGTPETVLGLKSLVVNLLKEVEMLVEKTPQIRCVRIAWTVKWQRLAARKSHDQAVHRRRAGA